MKRILQNHQTVASLKIPLADKIVSLVDDGIAPLSAESAEKGQSDWYLRSRSRRRRASMRCEAKPMKSFVSKRPKTSSR